MHRSSCRRSGLTLTDTLFLGAALLLVVSMLLPIGARSRRIEREQQNNRQLRGIHQGLFTSAQSGKHSRGSNFYAGLDLPTGRTIPVRVGVPARQLGATQAVPGYAAEARGFVLREEMNTDPTVGFITRVFAELEAGVFIPGHRGHHATDHFISPSDLVKIPFVPGKGQAFTAANISYTTLDLSRQAGDTRPLTAEWRETINGNAVVLADRAVGDGNNPATRSSVWTDDNSGEWRGSVLRNDGSVAFEETASAVGLSFGSGAARVNAPLIDNLFSDTFSLTPASTPGAPAVIASTSGLLYDEPDAGTDPNAF